MNKTNQSNVRLDKERLARLDRATVFRELLDLYMDDYEEAEEARMAVLERQKAERGRNRRADGNSSGRTT